MRTTDRHIQQTDQHMKDHDGAQKNNVRAWIDGSLIRRIIGIDPAG